MAQTLRLICVDGPNKGKYYIDYGDDGYSPRFGTHEEAEVLTPRDAASLAMGLLDTVCEIVAIEKSEETTAAELDEVVGYIANGMWQNPGEALVKMVNGTIRTKDQNINDRPAEMPTSGRESGFISVWEWLGVTFNASKAAV